MCLLGVVAAAGLYAYGAAASIEEGVTMAYEVLSRGDALRKVRMRTRG